MRLTNVGARLAVFCTALGAGCSLLIGPAHAGTWTEISNFVPVSSSLTILLSNGTVLFHTGSTQDAILHPDASGNYSDGTWTIADPLPWSAWCCPDSVLNDGTWLNYGGEYSAGNVSESEIYNPATDAWTISISPISSTVYDTFNTMLANGMVLNNSLYGPGQGEEYNWQTGSWSANVAAAPNWGDEANVELLPDGDVFDPLWLQQYSPSLNSWITLSSGPISDGGDPGPATLLYNGQVMVQNAANQIEYYIPSTTPGAAGTWSSTVTTLPSGVAMSDTASAVEPNDDVLLSSAGNVYELIPSTNTVSQLTSAPSTGWIMPLPNGQMIIASSYNAWVYTPSSGPSSSWRPTVSSVTGSGPYTLTGTQLFGLGQSAADNDDANGSTNYPIVYLKSGTNVWYCRSFGYGTRAVAQGSTAQTCQFSLPMGLAAGTYSLYVSVNGIASSSAYSFTAPATPTVCVRTGQVYLVSSSANSSAYINSYQNTAGTNPIDAVGSPYSDNNCSWTFVQNSNGSYTMSHGGEGGIVLDGNGSTGNVVERSGYNGGTNEEWNLIPVAGGYYEISNFTTGDCMDGGTNPQTLTKIVQDSYTGATGQKWALTLVNGQDDGEPAPAVPSGQEYTISPSSNGLIVINSYSGGGTVGQPPIDIGVGGVNSDCLWTLTQNSNSTYTIKDDGGLVLDGNGVTTSGNVIENNSNGGANQQWVITSLGSGFYEITNKTSGLALDGGTNPQNLQDIIQDSYTGATGQKWRLVDNSSDGFVVTYEPGLIPDWNAGNTGIPQQVDLSRSSSISFPVTVLANTATGGSVGTVTFSASGLPPGVTASFNPASVTGAGTTTCTLTEQPGSVQPNGAYTTPGIYTVAISGTGSGISAYITEGQDIHVNVLGSALANGTYSMVTAGTLSQWPTLSNSGWQPYIALNYDGNISAPASYTLLYAFTSMQWTATQVGSYYELTNQYNGLALTDPSSAATNPTVSAYTGAANQLWSLTGDGMGLLIANDAYPTEVLDLTPNTTNTINVQPLLDHATGAASQCWIFTSNTSD
jgi:hypothetical protein